MLASESQRAYNGPDKAQTFAYFYQIRAVRGSRKEKKMGNYRNFQLVYYFVAQATARAEREKLE